MSLLKKLTNSILSRFVTNSERLSEISETRDIDATQNRDIKPIIDSLCCPYCQSTTFVKKGFRMKKREKVQLYQCNTCSKVFTPRMTRGKHYPLAVMLDAISIYNLGYSLEQTCRIVTARHQKTPHGVYGDSTQGESNLDYHLSGSVSETTGSVKRGVEVAGFAPAEPRVIIQVPHSSTPTPNPLSQIGLSPSTLATWISETEELCRFSRMREFALKRYAPKDMVAAATLVHQQLYRYRFHRAKAYLCINEEYQHRKFVPVREFLEAVPGECPHQYFSARGGQAEGLRASETPLTFSKTQMIVRAKTNYATRMAGFVLQSVTERKSRHEAIQKFFLACDSVTVATEVPVYLTRDDLLHMKSQLGFEIYQKTQNTQKAGESKESDNQTIRYSDALDLRDSDVLSFPSFPKLITGHIDLLQIRNGMIHILDYKPNAEKEKPIEQLTLYAMALSRLTGLRLYEFKCAWFDEKDYFEFYPLHVLHKTKKAGRRRKIETKEGVYTVNQNPHKVEKVRPI